MSFKQKEYVNLGFATVVHTTDEGIIVSYKGEEAWFPLSELSPDCYLEEQEDSGSLIVSEWLAIQRGLI